MKLKYLLAASIVSLAATTTIATPAFAQQITTDIEGRVVDDSGNPVAGAVVTVTNTATNAVRTTSTDSDGSFRATALPPGGPYEVTANAGGFEGQTVQDVYTALGRPTAFTFTLAPSSGVDSVIIVSGARAGVTQLAVGPGQAFGLDTLERFPSITRDIRDIIRIDPRVSLDFDEAEGLDRISCLGGNDRSNTFTVDGIVQADVFGLNGTPFAARNSLPLPFDAIGQTSVEFAPFDVEYSDFTGCLVNVVTKSGSNSFSGSAFFTYFDAGLQAKSVLQADGTKPAFNAGEEKRWGATLSGPIIKDRLFFSFAYEETDLVQGFNSTPIGTNLGDAEPGVTLAEYNRFREIANRVYGQEPGEFATFLPNTSVRYFGRLDGQINDDHRVVATYQRLEESKVEDDSGASFSGINSFEDEGTISDYYSAQLYSQWSDTVSTELRFSRAEVSDVQGPLGFDEANEPNAAVRLVVGLPNLNNTNIPAGLRANASLLSGPGFFRSLNQLDTQVDQARFMMKIDAGDGHKIKLGAEINHLDAFNLFLPNATGTLFFQNLDDFEQGLITGGTSTNTSNNNVVGNTTVGAQIQVPEDFDFNLSAAEFTRTIYSFFAQDEWQATDQLSINAGVRVQLYDGGTPPANPLFARRFGFSNSSGFSSLNPIVLPRLSATYQFDNEGFLSNSSLTGGVGIFSGGDPVVYYSNAFANDGFTQGNVTTNNCAAGQLTRGAGGKIDVVGANGFTGVPQCVINAGEAIASQGAGNVQSIDPNFDVPTAVRANLGFATDIGTETGFFSNWQLRLDYVYTRFNDTLAVVDLLQQINPSLGLNGRTVDGRPIYSPIDPLRAGCTAQLVGTGGNNPQWTGLTPACFNAQNATVQEFLQLTNGDSFESHNLSVVFTKQFSEGLFTEGGSFNVNFGYAFNDSEQAGNFRSSTADSNFDGTAAFDPQNVGVSQSGFETRHNFTLALNLREEFIEDYNTSIGIFFRANEGRPYSLVFDDGTPTFRGTLSAEENLPAYIPTGLNDPNISPLSNQAALQAYVNALNGQGIISELNCQFTPGQTIGRNTCRNPWTFDMDFRFSQELPFLGKVTGITQDKIELYVDVANALNLIDENWNAVRTLGGFEQRVALVQGAFDPQGRYVISNFNANQGRADTAEGATAWRIQFGVRYEF